MAEKMAKLMAGCELGSDVFSDNEKAIADAIQQVEALHEMSNTGDPIPPDDLRDLKSKLVATQGIIRQAELSIYSSQSSEAEARRRAELESRQESQPQEYAGHQPRHHGGVE